MTSETVQESVEEQGAEEAGLVDNEGNPVSVDDAIKNDDTVEDESDEITQDNEEDGVPEWVPEKFIDKESGKPDFEKMAKSYDELEKKLLEKNKIAPEKYELSEGLSDLNTEHQDYKDFVAFAKEANIGNETFNQLIEFAQDSGFLYITDPEAEIKELGDEGDAILKRVSSFAEKHFNEEEKETLETMALTANQVKVLNKIVGIAQSSVPAQPGKVSVDTAEDYQTELDKLMNEPDIRTNQAKKRRAEELANKMVSMS